MYFAECWTRREAQRGAQELDEETIDVRTYTHRYIENRGFKEQYIDNGIR